jgi:hypothetical protein
MDPRYDDTDEPRALSTLSAREQDMDDLQKTGREASQLEQTQCRLISQKKVPTTRNS